jgi:tRNA-dihydrouridine synthase
MNPSPTQIWLAPLRGFTDAVFRNVYREFYDGLDGAIAPFITTVQGDRIKPSHIKDVIPENNSGLPLVPQILSKSAKPFVLLAMELHHHGYEVINWNLGCPYPMVAKKGRGSGLLPHPEKVTAFLDAVLPRIPIRLSIKMRLGYFSTDELFNLLPLLNPYPLEEIIIHPRTGKQMYDGLPNTAAFADCLPLTSHSVVYNGDIKTRDDFLRLQKRFPTINKWLIGRGILTDPMLPARIKNSQFGEKAALRRFQRFHDRLYEEYSRMLCGPGHLLSRMKGFWRYFALNFNAGPPMLKKIQKCKHVEVYRHLVDSLVDLEMEDKTAPSR